MDDAEGQHIAMFQKQGDVHEGKQGSSGREDWIRQVDGAEDHGARQHENDRPPSNSTNLLEVVDQDSKDEELLDHAPERV